MRIFRQLHKTFFGHFPRPSLPRQPGVMPKHLHQRRAGLVKDLVHPLQVGVALLLRGGAAAAVVVVGSIGTSCHVTRGTVAVFTVHCFRRQQLKPFLPDGQKVVSLGGFAQRTMANEEEGSTRTVWSTILVNNTHHWSTILANNIHHCPCLIDK